MDKRRKVTVKRYKGGNERLDKLLSDWFPDDVLWMVNGKAGRKPINAETEEEALSIYASRYE